MKFRMIPLLLAALLLTGCAAGRPQPDAAMDVAGKMRLPTADAVESAAMNSPSATESTAGLLTREEAQAIALQDAGFTADQVTYLRTEYEIDEGVPQYEVQFHQGRWEYDYEINARTGAILSYDRDD